MNRYFKLLCFFLFYFYLTPFFAQDFNPDQIDKIIESKIEGTVPGLALGIVKDGKIIYEKYIGYANLAHNIKVDEYSKFNIASTAKQFTAICILDLVLKGQLSLEDDFRKHLSGYYPNIKEEIKVKHLLTHSSGIRDFYDLLSLQGKPWWAQTGLDNSDALALLKKQQDLNFDPGSEYLYSNSGYIILTKLVEKISGKSFDQYADELFKSLGMSNTSFSTNYMAVIPGKTLPYSNWGDGQWQQYPAVVDIHGDGFLFTTLKDQLVWEQLLQVKEVDKLRSLLTQSQEVIPSSEIKKYGYGVEFDSYNGYQRIIHKGGTGSYNAQFIRFPSEKLSIFAMSNNGNIWSGGIANQIADQLLKDKIIAKADDQVPANLGDKLALELLVGKYKSEDDGIINISQDQDNLLWKVYQNNPMTLIHEKGNLYYTKENEDMKVLFSKENNQQTFTVYYPGSKPRNHDFLPDETFSEIYYSSLNGTYKSEELDTEFILHHLNDGNYAISIFGDTLEAALLAKDIIQMGSYKMKIDSDVYDRNTSILVSSNRIQNVKFKKQGKLIFHPVKETEDGGQISVNTTKPSYGKGKGDILLTKTNASGNEEWFQSYGGSSYDLASSVQTTSDGGFVIIGSTSSFGKGNYDVWLVKTDAKGNELWNKTFGDVQNEYGYTVEQTPDDGFLIKGKKQIGHPSKIGKQGNFVWIIKTDKNGNEEWTEVLDDQIK